MYIYCLFAWDEIMMIITTIMPSIYPVAARVMQEATYY